MLVRIVVTSLYMALLALILYVSINLVHDGWNCEPSALSVATSNATCHSLVVMGLTGIIFAASTIVWQRGVAR